MSANAILGLNNDLTRQSRPGQIWSAVHNLLIMYFRESNFDNWFYDTNNGLWQGNMSFKGSNGRVWSISGTDAINPPLTPHTRPLEPLNYVACGMLFWWPIECFSGQVVESFIRRALDKNTTQYSKEVCLTCYYHLYTQTTCPLHFKEHQTFHLVVYQAFF